MKSVHQMNYTGGSHLMFPKGTVTRISKTNDQKKECGTSLYIKGKINEPHESPKNNRYEYLDSSHLEMLDLNKNIQHIMPKPVKPSLNLETLCKETNAMLKHNRNALEKANLSELHQQKQQLHLQQQQHKNTKHLYELGLPEIIGTYIQPLNKNINGSIKKGNQGSNPFPLASASVSPFFQPPNFSPKQIQPSSKFLPLQLNNEGKNMYGLPSYLVPEDKPKNLTVTVVPNKDKDILEQEAKQLKLLLDSSSQGIVNSTPDYQKIISSSLLSSNNNNNGDVSRGSSDIGNMVSNNSYRNGNKDIESDFSFGKNENSREENYCEHDAENNKYDSFFNEFYHDTNNFTFLDKGKEFTTNDPHRNNEYNGDNKHNDNNDYNAHYEHNERGYYLTLNEDQLKSANKKIIRKGVRVNGALNGLEKVGGNGNGEDGIQGRCNQNVNEENKKHPKKASSSPSKKIQLLQKKREHTNISLKNLEPSTSFKNSKTYINIRLGKPKKLYIVNSSDPIDKKLKDWHNTHNSQINWKKSRRGVYTFGKTEVVLSLVHDKIIVKRINGKNVKDNLLTVEKFVSLNELFELHRE
ncbi:hypothetical protein, conserved [Plasmodium gonderi]|uniref:Uncharacterized protein n=1 Tax=Plasmodium gonderi TaxID=77519 RepID=A0A1Y1J903_PLAGO|nr:hypothetical protein, conserved [Plasmodium gonderi]GAW78986.1 hypothetical protein, conserved [Plasmodium gonderi]